MPVKTGSLLIVILLLFCNNAISSDQDDEIIFLTLQITGDQITLVESITANGSLKRPRTESGSFDINFEIVSKSENILQVGGIDDPRFQILEYEDPDNQGQLKHIEVVREIGTFVIRVQADQNLSHVNFFRHEELTKSDGSIERSRIDLGRVDLSTKGGDQ